MAASPPGTGTAPGQSSIDEVPPNTISEDQPGTQEHDDEQQQESPNGDQTSPDVAAATLPPGHPRQHHHTVTAAERALHNQYNILPRRQLIVCLATLSATLLICFMDQNGITVTLPTIASELRATDTISWAGTASLLANTTFQMLYGRLSDIFGRKTVFLAAVALLALADLLSGLARGPAEFYAYRALAGIGSGGITNLSMIIVSDVVTLEDRGKYQGIFGSMIGIGNAVGPFVAAGFMQRGGEGAWRGFFYCLAPLGALVGGLAWFYLPDHPPTTGFKEGARKIDYLGSITSSLGVILLLIPISGGGSYFAWDSPLVISMLAIGGLACILFVFVEWKIAKLPMMPLTIFTNKAVVAMFIQTFIFGGVYQAAIYFLPLYLINARGFSIMQAAGVVITFTSVQAFSAVTAGFSISKFKRYGEVIWFGFIVWTIGTGLLLTFTRTTPAGQIAGILVVLGVGVGCVFQPTLVAIQCHSPIARRAVIISNRNFFRCAGGAVNLAMSSAVLQAALRAKLPDEYSHLSDSTYSAPASELSGGGATEEAALDAYMYASRAVFIMHVPMVGLCLLGLLFVKDRGLGTADDDDVKGGEGEAGKGG